MVTVTEPLLNLPSQQFVSDKLRTLGNILLKNPYKTKWTEDNPTLGYCYIVSEAFYHYGNISGKLTPMVISYGEGVTHWFLKTEDGTIIDFTYQQFLFTVDYSIAVRCPFFNGGVQTERGLISKRGQYIAELLELT